MNRQCLWSVVKEGVCRERGTDIQDEVVYGTVSGMHDVGLVLQQVIDALNNASLAEHENVSPCCYTLLYIGVFRLLAGHAVAVAVSVLNVGVRAVVGDVVRCRWVL